LDTIITVKIKGDSSIIHSLLIKVAQISSVCEGEFFLNKIHWYKIQKLDISDSTIPRLIMRGLSMKQWLRLMSIGILLFLPKANHLVAEFENTPKLVVRGEASVFKPADQMEVSLGVVTLAENSTQALNENNRRMHQVVANLQELGLDESDYQTGRFHIRPIYQKPPKDSEEEEHSVISRYEVTNSIQIKTQKIALADKILSAAVQGGANQVEQVNFNINNPHKPTAQKSLNWPRRMR
jgi:uncharacterized protein YggE